VAFTRIGGHLGDILQSRFMSQDQAHFNRFCYLILLLPPPPSGHYLFLFVF
jgi:hypothetical protein